MPTSSFTTAYRGIPSSSSWGFREDSSAASCNQRALRILTASNCGYKYTETLLGARWATDLHIHPRAFNSLDLEDYNHTRLKYSRTTSNLCYANPHSKVQVTRVRHSCRVCRYFIWRKTELHSIWEPLCTSSANIFIVCIILITIPKLTRNVWCCISYPFPCCLLATIDKKWKICVWQTFSFV